MGSRMTPRSKVFLDTAYAIALSSPKDEHHGQALRLAEEIEAKQVRLVTTRAVVFEIGNSLARQRHRAAAIELLEALDFDPPLTSCPTLKNSVHRLLSFTALGLTKNGA